jgi:hypothetical protein
MVGQQISPVDYAGSSSVKDVMNKGR